MVVRRAEKSPGSSSSSSSNQHDDIVLVHNIFFFLFLLLMFAMSLCRYIAMSLCRYRSWYASPAPSALPGRVGRDPRPRRPVRGWHRVCACYGPQPAVTMDADSGGVLDAMDPLYWPSQAVAPFAK